MSKQFLAAIILISACLSGPARAEDAAAPFDGDLQRLAEILGTLHYLRGICGSNEGPKWRNEMQAPATPTSAAVPKVSFAPATRSDPSIWNNSLNPNCAVNLS
jgi:uncharacterized protein (TIGR02301 family)